jgi:hypothetical protein
MEVWKKIDCNNYYEVSNYGNIRSVDRIVEHKTSKFLNIKSQKIKPALRKDGYLHVHLAKDCKSLNKTVHRLVAIAFLENPLNKFDINHKDGNKSNNNLSNLEWNTRSENLYHAYNIGLKERGEKHYNSKLTEIQVNEIRSINGVSQTQIGINYNVSRKCISKILKRQTWKHI